MVPNTALLVLEWHEVQKVMIPKAVIVYFGNMKHTICYSAICLPLGAATGPTAQSLLSAEFREKNRAFNNFRRGADTIRPGTQVGFNEQ